MRHLQVLHQAGVPRDLFRTLILPSSEVKALIEDRAKVEIEATAMLPS